MYELGKSAMRMEEDNRTHLAREPELQEDHSCLLLVDLGLSVLLLQHHSRTRVESSVAIFGSEK